MTNTHLKSNRKFKPVKISDSLRALNQKFLYKFGKLDYIIHAKWAEIVGSFFVQHSEPRKISSISQSTDEKGEAIYEKYLHVNVTPSAAVEFQHFHNKILEKINSYFGYKAIKGIKIHQQLIKRENIVTKKINVNFINIKQKTREIKNTISKINDKDLEKSIVNLGLSITNEEEK